MRVLLDECVPKRLGRSLIGHAVRTVPQEGWSGKKNGELLALMSAAGFEVLLTVDQGIPHQQNLRAAGVAVVVLFGASNQLADLLPLVPDLLVTLVSFRLACKKRNSGEGAERPARPCPGSSTLRPARRGSSTASIVPGLAATASAMPLQ